MCDFTSALHLHMYVLPTYKQTKNNPSTMLFELPINAVIIE